MSGVEDLLALRAPDESERRSFGGVRVTRLPDDDELEALAAAGRLPARPVAASYWREVPLAILDGPRAPAQPEPVRDLLARRIDGPKLTISIMGADGTWREVE